jgi:multisubunit Na+/H+ antiporter MnhC subunit
MVAALAVLVAGHNLVFLLTYGPDYALALAGTGHDGRWNETVRAVLTAAVLVAAAGTLRLVYLYRLVRRLNADGWERLSRRGYFRTLLQIWARLFAISTLLFLLQENYERWTVGLQLPGVGVLLSFDGAGPVVVFLLVSLVVGAVAALFEWGIAALEAQIAVGHLRPRAASSPLPRRRPEPIRPSSSILGRNLAGRAPPAPLTQH